MNALFNVEFQAMASPCQVLLAAAGEAEARALAQAAIAEVLRIETKYSRYRADSVVSAINGGAGRGPVQLDPETLALLQYAGQLFELSGGLFDITTGVLRKAWNFSVPRVPAPDELAPLLALTGWRRVERDAGSVRLPQAGMELDFGGFGKEYAADRAAAILQAQGVQSGYVNLGGDLRVLGPQPDGSPWRIGIQHPRPEGEHDQTMASIDVSSGALATSGDYERYFELDGRRYCHILDPASGYPVTAWRSVSVLAPLTVAAGACATIAMLKGPQGLDFLAASGNAWLAQDAAGGLHSSGV
ncbi:thiamine biosynthesis protein ApbE [Massilia sp. Root351]|jgi:thiamine biosynthesis lipoprotein|uniref:FAD:protein FMN transferase n=1 Tax=Massilia sp. Root351 TaxID=1736522 RepID=UPI00070E9543|nr:FAD:protein FMN transferase [Massilia sp. Root351]KQV78556.1 thiamine biosynthesis protein ApbE [Massilia sp. Root351]